MDGESKMSESQHLRLFIEDRLTAAAVEIFGVVEKTIREYEEQVVQSKREVEQLKQDIRHLSTVKTRIQMCRTDSQTVSEEQLPLQELNSRQELMSCQEDVAVQHQSPQVKEEQMDLRIIPEPESCISNIVTNGFVKSESTVDSQPIASCSTISAHQSPQVREEQVDICVVPASDTSISCVTNGFGTSESADSQPVSEELLPLQLERELMSSLDGEDIQHQSPRVKDEQVDLNIIPDSETGPLQQDSIEEDTVQDSDTWWQPKDHSSNNPDWSYSESQLKKKREKQREGFWGLLYQSASYPACQQITSSETSQKREDTDQPRYDGHHLTESFSHLCNLKIHKRLDSGEKSFLCKQCGKRFNHSGHLKRHQRIHSGEKPFMCKQCGKRFSQQSHLTSHQRIHTGEKPFHCNRCGRRFSQLQGMKKHRCVHTGENETLPL